MVWMGELGRMLTDGCHSGRFNIIDREKDKRDATYLRTRRGGEWRLYILNHSERVSLTDSSTGSAALKI